MKSGMEIARGIVNTTIWFLCCAGIFVGMALTANSVKSVQRDLARDATIASVCE